MPTEETPGELSVIILAAGAGSRMQSELPKPLHTVAGKPMLAHVLDVARELNPADITIVGSPELKRRLADSPWANGASVVVQDPPRGTADAVRVALESGARGRMVLVLYADHPLVTAAALKSIQDEFASGESLLAVMSCQVDNAAGYGRIDRDEDGNIQAIVERVADDPEKRTGSTEINSGVMAIDAEWARFALPLLSANAAKGEYFLTDLVAQAVEHRKDAQAVPVIGVEGASDLLIGVNDRVELATADSILRKRKREALQRGGVTLLEAASNSIDWDVEIGSDTVVGPFSIIESGTTIGAGCTVGPFAIIRNSRIGSGVKIESSTVENSVIGDQCDVGPYAHLRNRAELGTGVHVGNFAEIKQSVVGNETRIGHFSYIGDSSLGANVNIGAGTVTCNFDGTDKHRTEIGQNAFIGSDTLLIAPIKIGEGARTGAGAVVTKDVPDGVTVVGMPARSIRRTNR